MKKDTYCIAHSDKEISLTLEAFSRKLSSPSKGEDKGEGD
jgi:hypothetical protein